MLLEGKTAAISGAASLRGIGLATAKLFARHGARVAILDIDAAAAHSAAAALPRCDVGKLAFPTDPQHRASSNSHCRSRPTLTFRTPAE